MTANFAKNVPRAHARQAEVSELAASEIAPGIVGRLGETRSKSVALESKACRRGESSAKIFGDFNQEVRKTGEDQELLGIHSIALLRDAR
jgi:hypothetical protein